MGAFRCPDHYVVFDGQSRLTLPAGNTVPALLLAAFPNVFRRNCALGSTSWTGLTADVRSRRDPYLKVGHRTPIILIGGESDLFVENNSGAQTYADMVTYADAMRAAANQAYIIGCTICPSSSFVGGQETARQAANVLILDDANQSAAFDAVCNLAGTAGLSDYTSGYYTDELHFSVTGSQLAADTLEPYLATALAL